MLQSPETPPPPAFGDGEMLGRPPSAPLPRPQLPARPPLRPTPPKWKWLAPLLLLTAGVGGSLVFGVLTLLRAQSDLQSAKADVSTLQVERDDAVEKLEGAKQTAGSSVDEVARLKKDLAEARARTKEAFSQVQETSEKASELEDKLRASVQKSEGEVKSEGDRLTLNLVDTVLFKSGKSDLTTQGKKVIKNVGAVLKKAADKQIFVQGHTDDVPIPKSNKNFDSNWELSAARAISVVKFLEDDVKIGGSRLAVVAFSKYRPIDRKRKAKNRRIEIVLLPRAIKFVEE